MSGHHGPKKPHISLRSRRGSGCGKCILFAGAGASRSHFLRVRLRRARRIRSSGSGCWSSFPAPTSTPPRSSSPRSWPGSAAATSPAHRSPIGCRAEPISPASPSPSSPSRRSAFSAPICTTTSCISDSATGARGRGARRDAVRQPAVADLFHGRLAAAARARADHRDRARGPRHRPALRLQYRRRGGRRVRRDVGAPARVRTRAQPADQRDREPVRRGRRRGRCCRGRAPTNANLRRPDRWPPRPARAAEVSPPPWTRSRCRSRVWAAIYGLSGFLALVARDRLVPAARRDAEVDRVDIRDAPGDLPHRHRAGRRPRHDAASADAATLRSISRDAGGGRHLRRARRDGAAGGRRRLAQPRVAVGVLRQLRADGRPRRRQAARHGAPRRRRSAG